MLKIICLGGPLGYGMSGTQPQAKFAPLVQHLMKIFSRVAVENSVKVLRLMQQDRYRRMALVVFRLG